MFCPQCGKPLDEETCVCAFCEKDWHEEFVTRELVSNETEESVEIVPTSSEVVELPPMSIKSKIQYNRRVILIVGIPLIVILLAFGIYRGLDALYKNTDEYKINQAITNLQGNYYDAALRCLSEVNTTQATALRQYIAVEKSIPKIGKAVFEEYVTGELAAFYTAMDGMEDRYFDLLPYFAQKKILGYRAAMECAEQITLYEPENTSKLGDAIFDAQVIFENEIIRNQTSTTFFYTIHDAKERLERSENATNSLRQYCEELRLNDFSTNLSTYYALETIELERLTGCYFDLIVYCEMEQRLEEGRIENSLKKFGEYDELYLTTPDENYVFDLPDPLMDASYENPYQIHNAETVLAYLRTEILYKILVCEQKTN